MEVEDGYPPLAVLIAKKPPWCDGFSERKEEWKKGEEFQQKKGEEFQQMEPWRRRKQAERLWVIYAFRKSGNTGNIST